MSAARPQPGHGWQNLGEEPVFDTPWFQVKLAQVALPGGRTVEHYLLRLPPVVLTAVLDDRERVLLLWRHRFIPDSWGWELPSGIATDPAEDLAGAASRQALAESGWEPVGPRPLLTLEPCSGLTDSVCHVFWTDRSVFRGQPAAAFEADRIEWFQLGDVPALVADGQIKAAVSAAALLHLCCTRASRG
ncbi:MAG: NUDIX hydrolase [Streptosporangiaceae bacterium]